MSDGRHTAWASVACAIALGCAGPKHENTGQLCVSASPHGDAYGGGGL